MSFFFFASIGKAVLLTVDRRDWADASSIFFAWDKYPAWVIFKNFPKTAANIVIVSIISWLSVLYALNGRKVTVWILIRYEKVKI